jgi:hypothetical protein
VEWVIDS